MSSLYMQSLILRNYLVGFFNSCSVFELTLFDRNPLSTLTFLIAEKLISIDLLLIMVYLVFNWVFSKNKITNSYIVYIVNG